MQEVDEATATQIQLLREDDYCNAQQQPCVIEELNLDVQQTGIPDARKSNRYSWPPSASTICGDGSTGPPARRSPRLLSDLTTQETSGAAQTQDPRPMKQAEQRMDNLLQASGGTNGGVGPEPEDAIAHLDNKELELPATEMLVTDQNRRSIAPKTTLCLHYTSTGWCKHGAWCFYVHDRNKIALCPSVTLGIDCTAGGPCLLGHVPSAETLPSCVFFFEGRCKCSQCAFAHTVIAPRAAACADFAIVGYCEKGGQCEHQHLHECPGSVCKGVCDNPRCRFSHDNPGYERVLSLQFNTGPQSGTDGMTLNNDDQVGDGHSLVLEPHDEANGVIMQKEFIQQEDFIRL
ncbi:uncharacterized protein A1O9_11263 [Exophiala aquamarina CBS 119918]|uniref:C3H1-type domain-containing protein n=1 Tax=Exophiala aquamarina CBS 119918 TaxID=1182545 RepID=A0A072NZ39_9EURO|nr:uncharacterized protein A1O9_11263 [Exophiala aquamarina CBS 119918]KEF52846.1 hypothetical protein A1O9_11263 [Exophiala aquamarina CBS 119918]